MKLFRVPPYLPLLVLTCWAVLQGVSGSCSADGDCQHSGKCDTTATTCDCTGTGYDGDTCETDIDECSTSDDACDTNADCINTEGSFTCTCKSGYVGDGKTCTDINECTATDATKHDCNEHADCLNTPGSYTCTCKSGYAGDGKTCTAGVCSGGGKECTNGGTCDTSSAPTKCKCADGYTGDTCQNVGGTMKISAYLMALTVLTYFVIQ